HVLSYSRRSVFHSAASLSVIYTLSLHDALPISGLSARALSGSDHRDSGWQDKHRHFLCHARLRGDRFRPGLFADSHVTECRAARSEEHTSELQSLRHLVCRLLLEKKKKKKNDKI